MAKTKTSATKPKAKKKNAKVKTGGVTIKVKAGKSKSGKSGKSGGGFDALSRFAENPIVADLIAIGATAAVTAIASGMSSKSTKTSGNAVKDAGKAAAAAIGARLMTEFQAVKDSAAAAKAKDAQTTRKA
jgi:hypothetical protein